jgi:hypothetical protein
MRFVYEAVDRIPNQLQEGVVYHSQEFEIAALLCACGCGHRITLLVPDSHQVRDENGLATIRPSIGVFDADCKSHYVITAGEVEWLPAFTATQANSIMQHQIARHVEEDRARQTWVMRLKASIARIIHGIGSRIRLLLR